MKKVILYLLGLAIVVACAPSYKSSTKTQIISVPAIEGDATKAIQAAISQAEELKGRPVVIELQNAEYHLYRQSATSRLYYVSNTTSENENPDPTKHIGLWMRGLHNVTIDGRGAKLVMHGEMTSFAVDSCENICLRRFTVDYADPTVPEMTVEEVGEHHMVARIHPTSGYEIRDGILSFKGESWAWSKGIAQTYDPVRDITWRSWMPLYSQKKAEELESNLVRFEFDEKPQAKPGQVFQMRDSYRDEVCGLIQYSHQVLLQDIRINFSGNFSIVSQMSRDLTLRHITFEPEPGSGRTCSGYADFLHFSCCGGKIRVENSRFVGSQDDPINVHGTHLPITEFLSDTQLRVRYMHSQTYGFLPFLPGDSVDFIDVHTLLPVASAQVKTAQMENPRDVLVTLKKPISEEIRQHKELALENVTYTASVEIRGNHFSRVPTRGILISTRRPVVIEDNHFFRMKNSAIKIADDARSWFESGMVRDVLIRNNEFVECGNPVISIAPENDRNEGPVHQNIRVLNNRFLMSGSQAIDARSVRGFQIRGNIVKASSGASLEEPFRLTDCEEGEVEK